MFGDLIHTWSRAASAVREPPAAADVDPNPKTVLHASTLPPHSPKAPPGSSPRIRAATTSSLRRIHVIAAVPVTAASITPELAARFQSVAWSVQGTRRHLTLGSMAPGPPGAATQILGGPTITTRSSVGLSAWIVPSGRGLGTAARWGHPKTVCRSYWCGRRHARPCLGLASTLSQAGPTYADMPNLPSACRQLRRGGLEPTLPGGAPRHVRARFRDGAPHEHPGACHRIDGTVITAHTLVGHEGAVLDAGDPGGDGIGDRVRCVRVRHHAQPHRSRDDRSNRRNSLVSPATTPQRGMHYRRPGR